MAATRDRLAPAPDLLGKRIYKWLRTPGCARSGEPQDLDHLLKNPSLDVRPERAALCWAHVQAARNLSIQNNLVGLYTYQKRSFLRHLSTRNENGAGSSGDGAQPIIVSAAPKLQPWCRRHQLSGLPE